MTSIGNSAFAGCTGLTSVSIGNSVTEIDPYAFGGCDGLKKVEISDLEAWCKISFSNVYANPIYYSHNLFLNGQEIKNLIIPETVQELKSYVFYGCSGLTSVEIPNSVTSIYSYAFNGCSGLTSVRIGNSVTSIGSHAFYGCSGLTSVEIPNSVTSIDDYAFDSCIGLTSVVIPNSVTSIGNYAFYKCSGLKSVEIPNSVTTIGNQAFYGCSGLTSVVIGNSVTSIGYWAFRGCSGLTSVTSLNIIPPTLGSDVFYDVPADCVLYVPEGCVGAYQSDFGWKKFGTILEIQPGGVESISKAETAKVRGENGVIRVEGAEGARVEVFNTAGVCIYSGTDTEITVPQRGLYVVKVAGRATKLAL